MANITFKVFMKQPSMHLFHVEMHIANAIAQNLSLKLPVWTPGSYLVREYAKNFNYVHASDINGNPLPVVKQNKCTWNITTTALDVIVSYEIYAFEESVRTCWLDEDHASIIPAAFFMLPENFDEPVNIEFFPHPGFTKIASALNPINENIWHLQAQTKDELYDSPIEIGNHTTHTFIAANINHELAIVGDGNYNGGKIIEDLKKIISAEVALFQHHPCKKYLFILLNSNTLRGGLEHLNSTSLIFKRFNYEPRENYLEFISLVAHEYFHLWNVKRLRPAALGPFNYYEENYTTSLWIVEGFTSYYDDLMVYRAGISTEAEYLAVIEKNINGAQNAPGKDVQSTAEGSFDAWIKYYRQNENSNNSHVNYYVRGAMITMLLDIIIINNTNGKHCLDDVMREAYTTFYLENNRGYTEAEFKSILTKYANEDLNYFYDNIIFGTVQPDLNKYFEMVGLELIDKNKDALEADLGITINTQNNITNIRRNSAGEKCGLNVNDEIIAINNFRYSSDLMSKFGVNANAGDKIIILINRNGIIKSYEAIYQKSDKVNYSLSPIQNANQQQRDNYSRWLKRHVMA